MRRCKVAPRADRSFITQDEQPGLRLLHGAVGNFSFNADNRPPQVEIITGSQAIQEAVLEPAFVFDFQVNLVVPNDCTDLRATEIGRLLRECRSRDGRQSRGGRSSRTTGE